MLRYSIGATDPVWTALMTQITRLEQLKHFPYGPEAKKDLGKALAHADTIDEAREVIEEFVQESRAGEECPTYADIIALIKQRAVRSAPPQPPLEPQQSNRGTHCARCHGFGYYGGHLGGQYAGPWKWCDCENGKRNRFEIPELVNEANANREKLLRRFAVSMKKHGIIVEPEMKHVGDEYHGDF